MKAPYTHDGKTLVFEETFRSVFPRPTEASAKEVLDAIRDQHRECHGWLEIEARIEKTPAGFVAVRHHAQYK